MMTLTQGTNADLIANIAGLYLPEGALVADVTYGKGVFWRKCRQRSATIFASDLKTPPPPAGELDLFLPLKIIPVQADFRHLPYEDRSLDIVVLDPPYIHNPGQHLTDPRYNNAATTGGMYHADIVAKLYVPGIMEAARVLKPGGQLWVKCKDEIESSTQQWSHREMYDIALALHYFTAKDCAILHATAPNGKRWDRQMHLRKNHSTLWVFQRTMQPITRLGRHGGDRKSQRKSHNQVDKNINLIHDGGTGRQYLLARIVRDSPDVFVRFQAGEFRSVHAAAKAAGLIRDRKAACPTP
jgi:SAM-dependent methyltransferase